MSENSPSVPPSITQRHDNAAMDKLKPALSAFHCVTIGNLVSKDSCHVVADNTLTVKGPSIHSSIPLAHTPMFNIRV